LETEQAKETSLRRTKGKRSKKFFWLVARQAIAATRREKSSFHFGKAAPSLCQEQAAFLFFKAIA
jgi:hypothetical protein